MDDINELKLRLEEINSLITLAEIGAKKGLMLTVFLSYIGDSLYNTINEIDELII